MWWVVVERELTSGMFGKEKQEERQQQRVTCSRHVAGHIVENSMTLPLPSACDLSDPNIDSLITSTPVTTVSPLGYLQKRILHHLEIPIIINVSCIFSIDF